MKKLKILFGLLLLLSLVFVGCTSSDTGTDQNSEKIKATVYKSPSCECCEQYGIYLRSKGFDVTVVNLADTNSIKQQYGIPGNMGSCHTTFIDGYFVEGHIPKEAIDKLLTEKPNIDGIALPDMPSGSPGMPGPQIQPFGIYSIKDGQVSEFMVID